MNEVESELKQIEVNIDTAKALIKKMKAMDRLANNADFKDIIVEGYFKEESARLVMLLAHPGQQDKDYQELLQKQITAIGYLRQHFLMIDQMGQMALRGLASDEETQEELLKEAV